MLKIELSKIKSNNYLEYLANLEDLMIKGLETDDIYLKRSVASELSMAGGEKEISLLKKYEKKDSGPTIRFMRLIAETRKMDSITILKFCIKSALELVQESKSEDYPNFTPENSTIKYWSDVEESLTVVQREIDLKNKTFEEGSRKWKSYSRFLEMVEYRYNNPGKPTNPLMNPETAKIIEKYK